ncbi:NADH-ubiquinone oxidoreductase chain 1-like, partial [Lasioglossum baleicum]|uniref:NADH-ubiquinone oxidoreductase chain 1-like n=1 Tax=Lasioglossum baleicum TaxID=434251 RepID=UPI003FCEAE27
IMIFLLIGVALLTLLERKLLLYIQYRTGPNMIGLLGLSQPFRDTLILLTNLLVDLNRTTYDLIEGESELASGFNNEYHRRIFTIIFLSEYLNIIFIRLLLLIIFLIIIIVHYYFLFLIYLILFY